MVIVAVRTDSVAGLGHVGVAFQNANGTWTAGAVEGAVEKSWYNWGGAFIAPFGKKERMVGGLGYSIPGRR